MKPQEGNGTNAEAIVVDVLGGLKGARGRVQWLITNQGSAGLSYSLLETDSYLQHAIDALSRVLPGGAKTTNGE